LHGEWLLGSATVVVANTIGNNGYKGGPLPVGCPPPDAVDVPAGYLLRLVSANPCTADDFRARDAGRRPKNRDLCTWLSFSVWTADTAFEDLAGLAKLRTLSHMKYVARIKVTGSEGKIKPHPDDPRHLSFWMLESFAAELAVEEHLPL
jgi:hypothetical protein